MNIKDRSILSKICIWSFFLIAFGLSRISHASLNVDESNVSIMVTLNEHSEEILVAQISSALSAVENSGRVIFVTNSSSQAHIIQSLIQKKWPQLREKALIFSNLEGRSYYPWIRDHLIGGRQNIDGKYQAFPSADPSEFGKSVIRALLFCTNKKISLGEKPDDQYSHYSSSRYGNSLIKFEGGDFLTDGKGTCLTSKNFIWTNANLLKFLSCTKIIEKPDYEYLEKKFPHPNHHADVYAAFLASKVALVSDVDKDCTDQTSEKVRENYNEIAENLKRNGVTVFRQTLAAGCPAVEIRDSDFSRFSNTSVSLRSYTNLYQTKSSFVVPQFLPPYTDVARKYADLKQVGGNSDLQKRYEVSNSMFIKKLESLMESGVIPKKRIVQMPVLHDDVINGGGPRCRSWEIPNDLQSCNQENIDAYVVNLISQAKFFVSVPVANRSDFDCRKAKEVVDEIKLGFNSDYFSSKPLWRTEFDSFQTNPNLVKQLSDLEKSLNTTIDINCK